MINACQKGDSKTVQECLDQYPETINQPTAQNFTALHVLVIAEFGMRELNHKLQDLKGCAKAVLERNPRFSPALYGLTPLHLAALFGCEEMAKDFLDHLVDVPVEERFHSTHTQNTELHLSGLFFWHKC